MGRLVLLIRDQVPMEQARIENANRKKLISLHRTFFFGDEMTDIESAVELRYLTVKNFKYDKYARTKSAMFNSVFTEANFRKLTGVANSVLRDVDYYDDLRQIYEVQFY